METIPSAISDKKHLIGAHGSAAQSANTQIYALRVGLLAKLLKTLFFYGPLIFAAGFLAPLSAQVMIAMDWTAPFGLSPLAAGFMVAAALGIPAQLRGRWI